MTKDGRTVVEVVPRGTSVASMAGALVSENVVRGKVEDARSVVSIVGGVSMEKDRREPRVLLGDLTRVEVRALIESKRTQIGVVPVAATEQHLHQRSKTRRP